MRHTPYGKLLAATSLCTLFWNGPCDAQALPPVGAPLPPTAPSPAPPPAKSAEIVVTGTRIARPDLTQSSPVSVIGQQEITLRQPNSAEDLIRDLPSVRPNLGPAVNNGSNGSASVDLRGLGTNRTLVLLDGRRIVPFGLDGTVDLNVIPVALVERIDVVTGGASSVYGADAVAGVVNFITRRNFTGLDVQGNYRVSAKGDAKDYRIDAVIGADLADGRGNVVLGLGYSKRDPLAQTDRKVSEIPISSTTGLFQGSQNAVPAFVTAPNNAQLGLAASSFGAVVDPGTGLLRPALASDTFNTSIGTYLLTPLERYSIFASGRYELIEGVEGYLQGLFTRNNARIQLASSGTFTNTYSLPLNNPFLSSGIRNQLCRGRSISQSACDAAAVVIGGPGTPNYLEIPIQVQRRFTEFGPRGNEIDSTVFQVLAGFRGDITPTIHFDVSGQYGETKQDQRRENWGSFSKVQQSLRAFRNASGQPVCADPSNGCVPINLFGPEGSITQDMLAFVDLDAQISRKVRQSVVTGSVNGDLFGLRSPLADSPLGFALGAEYRKISAEANPDAPSQIQSEVLGTGARTPPDFGEYDVKEAFGELLVPLVRDRLIHAATLEGGIRFSDYSTTGPSTTWKAGGSLEPVAGLRFRAMRQIAVRSPNVQELFQSPVQALNNLTVDPCAGPAPTAARALCEATGAPPGTFGSIPQPSSGQINTTTSGNRNLDVERAKTWTLGGVYQPSFVRNLAITLDYFKIVINDAITQPAQADILNGCYSTTLNPSQTPNAFCDLIARNPLNGSLNGAGDTLGVILSSSNLGTIKTAGWDLGVTYRLNLRDFIEGGDPGAMSFAFNGSKLDSFYFQATPNSINRDCTGYYSTACTNPRPKYKWVGRASYEKGPGELSILWTHMSHVELEPIAPSPAPPLRDPQPGNTAAAFNSILPEFRRIPAFDYFDVAAKLRLFRRVELTFLVENLFNKKPPLVGSGVGGTAFNNGNTFPTVYDAIGRRYTAGARVKF